MRSLTQTKLLIALFTTALTVIVLALVIVAALSGGSKPITTISGTTNEPARGTAIGQGASIPPAYADEY